MGERNTAAIEFATPDLEGAGIVRHVSHSESEAFGQDCDTPTRVEMEMSRCVELNPVRSMVSTHPRVCEGQSEQQIAAWFDQTSEGRESANGILHVFEAVVGHHQVIEATMVLGRYAFEVRASACLRDISQSNVDSSQSFEAFRR
jgi:hypothetical protein